VRKGRREGTPDPRSRCPSPLPMIVSQTWARLDHPRSPACGYR
jgi:hypothetical protein